MAQRKDKRAPLPGQGLTRLTLQKLSASLSCAFCVTPPYVETQDWRIHGKITATTSWIKPLTSKEVDKLTSIAPSTIKHHGLGGVPGLVLVHTPSDYVGFALIYRHSGKRRKLTLGSAKMLSLAEARRLAANHRAAIEAGGDPHGEKTRA